MKASPVLAGSNVPSARGDQRLEATPRPHPVVTPLETLPSKEPAPVLRLLEQDLSLLADVLAHVLSSRTVEPPTVVAIAAQLRDLADVLEHGVRPADVSLVAWLAAVDAAKASLPRMLALELQP